MTEEQNSTTSEAGGTRSSKSGAGKLIVVVIVLTVLAILLVPGQKEADEPTPGGQSAGEKPSLLAEDGDKTGTVPAPSAEPASADAVEKGDGGPGSAARRLIRQLRSQMPPDLDKAYAAAQDFERNGKLDDAYLLYFFAAREGHGLSAMRLARLADPATFEANGLFEAPDELQANKWYGVALEAGVADASDALDKLRSTVEQKARAGDDRARRIMLQWK